MGDFSNIASNYTGRGILNTTIRAFSRLVTDEKSKRVTNEFKKQMTNYIDEVVVKLGERLDEYIVNIECNRENSFSEMYGSSAYVEEFKDILLNLMNCKLGEVKDLSVRDLIYNS